jgi:hypothetical protein
MSDAPPDDGELQRLVTEAQVAGLDTVRIVFARKTPPKSIAGTIRLYGRSGPWSSEDKRVERLDAETIAATFRVSDLVCYLRTKTQRCHALGCHESSKTDHLMCAKHWAMVPGRLQISAYTAKGRGNFNDVKISRAWLVAAEKTICWVAIREGRLTDDEAKQRIAAAKGFDGLEDGAATMNPYALLDAVCFA